MPRRPSQGHQSEPLSIWPLLVMLAIAAPFMFFVLRGCAKQDDEAFKAIKARCEVNGRLYRLPQNGREYVCYDPKTGIEYMVADKVFE